MASSCSQDLLLPLSFRECTLIAGTLAVCVCVCVCMRACVCVRVQCTCVCVCVCMHSACRAFDVELLYIAQQLHMPVEEVAVNWKEIEGTMDTTDVTLLPFPPL